MLKMRNLKNPKRGDIKLDHIDVNNIDIDKTERRDFPVIEHTNNAIIWPESPRGRLDLMDTYEISSVPEDPGTPLESVELLEKKGIIPK